MTHNRELSERQSMWLVFAIYLVAAITIGGLATRHSPIWARVVFIAADVICWLFVALGVVSVAGDLVGKSSQDAR
jgi:hypothetical protein